MHTPWAFISLFAMALQVQGHMLLYKPQRFTQTGDNSPLVGPGAGTSNYPCKVMGNYQFDFPRTQIPLGSQYEVVFQGESVHGGGSCQFALSKDLEPTAQSQFKVIHSIQGGCPARNTPGNLGDDSSYTAIDPFTYNFTMPSNIPPGKYTFAWSWFNKVGNREMYMNCAPIEVTAGSNKRALRSRGSSGLDGLPDLFLANIPDVKCSTSDYPGDLSFPDPGKSVEDNVATGDRSPPVLNGGTVGECKAPVNVQGGSPPSPSPGGYGSYGGYGGSGGYNGGSGGYGSYGGYSSPSPVPSPTPVPSFTPVATPTPAPTGPGPYPPKNSSAPTPFAGSPKGSGVCGSGKVSCPSPGSIICVGSSQFGLCDMDGCAVPQALAAGTSCSGGMITKRTIRIPPQARPNRIYENGHRHHRFFL